KDILKEVLLTDGKTHAQQRFIIAVGGETKSGNGVFLVDPVRLPHDLTQWAWAHEGVQATLTVLRYDPKTGKERAPVVLPPVDWDDSPRWRFDQEFGSLRSPLAIPGLGLAYRVDNTLNAVSGPAVENGLQQNDIVKSIHIEHFGEKPVYWFWFWEKPKEWLELKPNQGAWAVIAPQIPEVAEIWVKLERREKEIMVLKPQPDGT